MGSRPLPSSPKSPADRRSDTPAGAIDAAQAAVGEKYRVESLAGRGGSGHVFSAHDTTTNRRVAIKLLAIPERPSTPGEGRLASEARAMANLDHPGLCRVIEVAPESPTPYLAMEWADGEPLTRYATRLTARARVTLILRVIDAAAAMHRQGLTHGDLKPANILVDRSGNPTIVDFGLARADSDPTGSLAQSGGSPGYAAPEQIVPTHAGTEGADPVEVGPEADVFALGVMLYELLTDRPPLPRSIAPAVFVDLLTRGAIRLPDELAPDTPADLQKICLAAMEPLPHHRYRDAGTLAADIRRYLKREAVAARPRLLAERLSDEVESQIARTLEWQRLGMISKRDAENAAHVLRGLPYAESPWIIDARRLRGSQITLSMGGWLTLIALTLGLAAAPLPTALTAFVAWIAAAAPLILGLRLLRSAQKRLALGMLLTAQLAVPAALWITLGPRTPAPVPATESPLPASLADPRFLAASIAALLTAIVLRRASRHILFATTLTIAALAAWLGLFASLSLHVPGADAAPRFAAWLLGFGVAALPVAYALHARGERTDTERRRANPAAPLFVTALLSCAAGLWALAATAPGWFVGRPGLPATQQLTAYAFLASGLLLSAAVVPLVRGTSRSARRTIACARWILPTHLMLPLLFMEVHQTAGVRLPWLALLFIASIACIVGSALQQWRPYLIPGFVFLAAWYARAAEALPPPAAAALALATLAVGLTLMVLAWRAPAYLAKRRLEKWTRAAEARPDPESRRTWR